MKSWFVILADYTHILGYMYIHKFPRTTALPQQHLKILLIYLFFNYVYQYILILCILIVQKQLLNKELIYFHCVQTNSFILTSSSQS